MPETPNGAPFTVITLILRSEEPVLVSVTGEDALVPIVTAPKLRVLGAGVSWAPATVAVALRLTGAEIEPVSVFSTSIPLTPPFVLPLKDTERFAVDPAASESGKLTPEMVNCGLVSVAAVTFIVAVPVFFTDKDCETLWPRATFPKFRFEGVICIVACWTELPLKKPAHPAIRSWLAARSPRSA